MRENLVLGDKYKIAKRELDAFMVIYRKEEAVYKKLVVAYELEEKRKQSIRISTFMMNIAARKIQRYWGKWRAYKIKQQLRAERLEEKNKKKKKWRLLIDNPFYGIGCYTKNRNNKDGSASTCRRRYLQPHKIYNIFLITDLSNFVLDISSYVHTMNSVFKVKVVNSTQIGLMADKLYSKPIFDICNGSIGP